MSNPQRLAVLKIAEQALSAVLAETPKTLCDVGQEPYIYATMAVTLHPDYMGIDNALSILKRQREELSE